MDVHRLVSTINVSSFANQSYISFDSGCGPVDDPLDHDMLAPTCTSNVKCRLCGLEVPNTKLPHIYGAWMTHWWHHSEGCSNPSNPDAHAWHSDTEEGHSRYRECTNCGSTDWDEVNGEKLSTCTLCYPEDPEGGSGENPDTLGTPVVVQPGNNSTVPLGNVLIKWNKVDNATDVVTKYHIKVVRNSNNQVIIENDTTATSYTIYASQLTIGETYTVTVKATQTDMTSSPESSPVSFTVIEVSIPSIQLFRYNGTVVAEASSLIVLDGAGISQIISLENSGWSPLIPSVSNTVVSLYKGAQVIQISSLSSEAKSYLISQGWSMTLPVGKTVLYKNNKFIVIDSSNSFAIAEKISLGWTDTPPAGIIVYKGDQYAVISSGEIQSYLNDGWIFDPITAYQGTGNEEPEVFDTETRDINPISTSSNNITFSNPSRTWHYITEDCYINCKNLIEYLDVEIGGLTNEEISFAAENYLNGNNINLSIDELNLLYRYDPWGVKVYLTYKNDEELTKNVFKSLFGRDPQYYSWIDGSWQGTNNWSSSGYSEADAALTCQPIPGNLVTLVTVGLAAAAVMIGVGELALIAEGISLFGLRNALTMWSYGTLESTIAFQNGLNGSTNAANMADEVIMLEAGTWQKPWIERGNNIDTARRNNLGHNFPIADNLENRILTSTKSLDTAATTYQDGSKMLSKLKAFINQLNGFTRREWNGVVVEASDYSSKVVELVIPDVQLSSAQAQAIIDAKVYAQSLGLVMKIVVGREG